MLNKYFYIFSYFDPNGQQSNLRIEVLADNYNEALKRVQECGIPGEKRTLKLDQIVVFVITKEHSH